MRNRSSLALANAAANLADLLPTSTTKGTYTKRNMKMSELPGNANDPSFIFFPEIIELEELEEPVQIGQHAVLHKATPSQKTVLRELLQPYVDMRMRFCSISPWEHESVPLEDGSTEYRYIVDPDHHQYWVVTHWRRIFDLVLEQAMELADPSLTPVISLMRPTLMSSGALNRHAILNWLHDNIQIEKRILAPKHIHQMERAFHLLSDFEQRDEPNLAFIHKALRDFADLKYVPKRKPLYVVGLFSIIESLIAANQEGTTGKSLNHQLQEKLTLMNNRFFERVDPADYFGKSDALQYKTVIKKLYQYRSDIAHGNVSDFSKDLKVLENHGAVCTFLHTLTRRLILEALQEPELMRDLKAC